MLYPAYLFKEKLQDVYHKSIYLEKNKYYNASGWTSFEIDVPSNDWEKYQWVSIDESTGQVIGYFCGNISRIHNSLDSLRLLSFSDESRHKEIFGADLLKLKSMIFERFRKLSWSVIKGNPVEASYNSFLQKIGGRVVGIVCDELLIDGVYHDKVLYEWLNPKFLFRTLSKADPCSGPSPQQTSPTNSTEHSTVDSVVNDFIRIQEFVTHSGLESNWKLECDNLSDSTIESLAALIASALRPFSMVIGIPRGGIRLSSALQKYCNYQSRCLLIVDDVMTTGESFRNHLRHLEENGTLSNYGFDIDEVWGTSDIIKGACIFARGENARRFPHWVTPLFTVSGSVPFMIDFKGKVQNNG